MGREREMLTASTAGLTQPLPVLAKGTFSDKLPREDKSAVA